MYRPSTNLVHIKTVQLLYSQPAENSIMCNYQDWLVTSVLVQPTKRLFTVSHQLKCGLGLTVNHFGLRYMYLKVEAAQLYVQVGTSSLVQPDSYCKLCMHLSLVQPDSHHKLCLLYGTQICTCRSERCMSLWAVGDINSLVTEGRYLQKKLSPGCG